GGWTRRRVESHGEELSVSGALRSGGRWLSRCRPGSGHGSHAVCAKAANRRGDPKASQGTLAVHAGPKYGGESRKLSRHLSFYGGGHRHCTYNARSVRQAKDSEHCPGASA